MSEWAPKRFWTQTAVESRDGGFAVLLDAREVKTPAKTAFILPTRDLADAAAAEWDAIEERIDPGKMPVTRMANSALDKVATQHSEVADLLAAYADADLTCYRAEAPVELVDRQAVAWDPILDWAAVTFDARLSPRTGIMHAPQDDASLRRLSREVHAMDSFQLAAFHDLVSLSGSLLIALAVTHGLLDAQTAWDVSRVDENWQIEQWGEDEEAAEQAAMKRQAFLDAALFFRLADQKN
ncbi:ATP12 family chaperone protein [Maritimibacter dapengensis]|uniref:ATPase n=1 Tax=Maritimibacter dapengensis TaxID=2836868 RepID=A0ABS6T5N7_9RHOB|nr:ATP12 family protein [Maritimibacter dapengensis]MBV7380559.1 ATPase [Maritimibacter dapengensis]